MVVGKKVKDFLTLGSSNLISSLLYGIFWLYLASIIAKTEYGELGFFMGIVNVGFTISLLGLRKTIMVYEPKKENVFLASFAIILISSTISSIVVYFITQNLVVSILLVGLAIFNIIITGLNSKQLYKKYSSHVILRPTLTVVLALILQSFLGITGILLGYFLTTIPILKELPSFIRNNKFEFSVLKSKISFTVFSYANTLSSVFFQWGDKLVIGALFGFSLLGSYFFAAQYLLLLQVIPRSVQQYILPQEAEGQKNTKLKIFSVILAGLISVASIIFVPIGIENLLPEYKDSILPIQIMSIGIIPLTISSIQQTQFLGRENSKIVLIGGVIQSSLYLILLVILGQSHGLVGLAYSFLIAVIIRTIFNQFIEKQLQKETS